jgi:hypothetical protein
MIAVGIAPGYWSKIDFDPVRVAHSTLRCDPDRVEMYVGERTMGAAPGYHMLPLQGTDGFSDNLYVLSPPETFETAEAERNPSREPRTTLNDCRARDSFLLCSLASC